MGAIGNGSLDALVGGLSGILIGSGLLAALYPRLKDGVLRLGYFGDVTLPKLMKVDDWVVIVPLSILLVLSMVLMERAGV